METDGPCALCGGIATSQVARWAVCAACRGELDGWARAERVARLQAGRLEALADPERHLGPPPYGYKAAGRGRLAPVPAELKVVEWIMRQRERGFGFPTIVEELQRAGTEPPRGRSWSVSTVRLIVARGVPTGVVQPSD